MRHRPLFQRCLLILSLLLALITTASAQEPQARMQAGDYSFLDRATSNADPLTIYLVTLSPGDAAYERFGHNMIHIIDHRFPATDDRRHVSFNFGVFDFEQENFFWNFIQGRMVYRLAVFRGDPILDQYIAEDRTITLQELDLTPDQKSMLMEMLWTNSQPEFANYRYDYFKDNCSTRLRDVIDKITGGQLKTATQTVLTDQTYRSESLRYSAGDWPLYYTLDILLGRSTDKPLTLWQEMFLPQRLMQEVGGLVITRPDGTKASLVKSTQELHVTHRPAMTPATYKLMPVLMSAFLGLGGAILIYWLVYFSRKTGRRLPMWIAVILGCLFCLGCGIFGLIMTWAWFTDHTAGHWNPNWLLLNPLSLAMVYLLPKRLLGQTEKLAWIDRSAARLRQQPALPTEAARCRRRANRVARIILLMCCVGSMISVPLAGPEAIGVLMLLLIPWQMCLMMVVTFYRVPTPANPAPAPST